MRQDDTLVPDDAVMGRPPKAIKLLDPLGIRFTEDQLTRIDKLLKDGRDTWPSVGVHNRNDLIRYLVEKGLKSIEEAAPMFGLPRHIGPPKRRR